MKRKIRVTAIFTALMMLFCAVSVCAYDSVWDDFESVCNIKGNTHIKADMSVEGSGASFGMLNGAAYTYDLNIVTNDDQTKASAAGTAEFKMPLFDAMKMNVWMDYDFANSDDFKYKMIIQALSGILNNQIGEKYLVMDFEKILPIKEIIPALVAMENEYSDTENSNVRELKEEIYSSLDEIKPIKDGDTYIFRVSMKDLKNLIIDNKENISDIIKESLNKDENVNITDEQINKIFDEIEKIDISALDFNIELKINGNGNTGVSQIYCEMNIDVDLYKLGEELSLNNNNIESNDDIELNKDNYKGSLTIKLKGTAEPLSDDYKIEFPELNESNSIDVFKGLPTDYLPNIFNGEAMPIGVIPDNNGGYNEIKVKYNGNEISFKNRPFVKQDRTFIALRELANMLGVPDENISYDENTEKINISFGSVNIEMQIGSQNVKVNNKELSLDVPAFTINDRTYIPVRFISEMFGKNVDYNDINNILTVTIDD